MTFAALPTSNSEARRARTAVRTIAPTLARFAFILILAAAAVAGFAAASAPAASSADPGLTQVLRAMALIKSAMAAGAAAAVFWRLGGTISPVRLTLYTAAGAAMAAGPGLIWTMTNLAAGALLLHAGLAATAILLWRDPAVGRRLSEIVAARRAKIAGRG